MTLSSLLSGCTTNQSPPISSTGPNPQPTPSGTLLNASLTITATMVGAIGSAFAGLSYEKGAINENPRLFTAGNANLIGLFKGLGPSVLRIGGNSVDKNVWNQNGTGQTSGQISPSDIDALAAFVKAAGWQCLYGVNLGGSATGATTPTLAAQEAAYAYQQFGSSLLALEIGNECDLYGNTGNYYAGNWSLAQFLTLWSQYWSSILAASPNIPITGPANAGSESTWTVPFGQAVTKSEITLLTQHYYRGNGQSPASTAANLITPDPTLINDLSILDSGAKSIGIPYRMAECNSYYNGGSSGVSDSYASSLWVIDYLFDCAMGGASGVNFHGGGNGQGYTPIADSGGAVVSARPEYYGILLFTLAGQGTLYSSQITAGSLNVTAYTVKSPSGGFNIVVVNKDSTNNLVLTIQLPQNAASANLLEMTQLTPGSTGPNLSATTGVTIQGATVGNNGSFSPAAPYTLGPNGTQIKCFVPALGAVLIQVT